MRERLGQPGTGKRADRPAGEDRGDFPPVDPGQHPAGGSSGPFG
jgi:hypothetical protein